MAIVLALTWSGSHERSSVYTIVEHLTLDSVQFGDVSAVAFNGPKQLLVLDRSAQSYFVIDVQTGELLRQIGRKGQGPGEFAQPSLIAAHGDTGVAVLDVAASMRLTTYSPGHTFIATLRFPTRQSGVPVQIVATSSDYLVLTVPSRLSTGQDAMLARFSGNASVSPLYEWEGISSEDLLDPFSALPLFAYLERRSRRGDNSILAVASNRSYVVTLLDVNGTQVGRIAPDVEAVPVPPELKAQMREQYRRTMPGRTSNALQFPEYLPAIVSLFPGPPDTLVVAAGESAEGGSVRWDLWSVPTGERVDSLAAPHGFLPMAARNGFVAGRVATEDHNWTVKVVSIQRRSN